jgi:hypothetical protein
MVALYCSGSRVSIAVLVGVVVVLILAFDVFVAVVFVVLVFVLLPVAGCCWHALLTRMSKSIAPVKNLADGFKTKLHMR